MVLSLAQLSPSLLLIFSHNIISDFANIFGRFGGEFDNAASEDGILIPGDFCESPDMYSTEILVMIDLVDEELKLIYNKLIQMDPTIL